MKAAWKTLAALMATVGVAISIAWTAHADDDDNDEDDDSSSRSSVESWPPTKISWPPLSAPTGNNGEDAPPVIPLP
jgi:hypothetical protein